MATSLTETDQTDQLRGLDIKQRKALGLFQSFDKVTSSQIGNLFNFKPRTSLCFVKNGLRRVFRDR